MGNLRSRSSRSLPGETTSHTQSGGSSRNGVAGTAGSRERSHPARSGTRISRARCSSGSKRMIHPPGPPASMESGTHVHAEHGCSFGVRPRRSGARVQVAAQHLGHDVVRRLQHVGRARVASRRVCCHRRDFITQRPFGRGGPPAPGSPPGSSPNRRQRYPKAVRLESIGAGAAQRSAGLAKCRARVEPGASGDFGVAVEGAAGTPSRLQRHLRLVERGI